MKKVLSLVIALFSILPTVKAQDKDEEEKTVIIADEGSSNYYYEGVVSVQNMTQAEMFKRAKAWTLSKFKTGDNNSQFDEQSMSIYNSSTVLLKNASEFMNFKISIFFKEGKYKFRFDNLIVSIPTSSGSYARPYGPKMFAKWYSKKKMKECNAILYSLSMELEKAVRETDAQKNNW